MDVINLLNQQFHAADTCSLNETKKRLQECSSKLECVLDYSIKLGKQSSIENNFKVNGTIDHQWQFVVDILSPTYGCMLHESVSKNRWDCILLGWMTQLRILCVVMEQLTVADKANRTESTSSSNTSQSPLDVISLHMICVVHCGLEFITQWGVGSRLDSETYGSMCRRNMKPLSKAVLKLLKIDRGGVAGLFTPVFGNSKESTKEKQTVEYTSEDESLRELRLCACSIVIEKCLNIPQIRSLLLPRYYSYLILSFLELSCSSQGDIKEWAHRSLLTALRPAPARAELDGENLKSQLILPAGLSISVNSLRELSSLGRGRVGSEIGGLLSAIVCINGGLEAVLDSFVGPVNAAQAAEDGSVEAVEALARHLGSPPPNIDSRISIESRSYDTDIGSIYIHSICPQLGSLLARSLFVYGLGNVQMDQVHTQVSRPPLDALSGLMAHMIVRLIGKTAETVLGDRVKEIWFRRHVIYPLLRPILLAQLSIQERVDREAHQVPPHLLHRSVVCIHAICKLVSPTPALLKLLVPAPLINPDPLGRDDPCFNSFCDLGVLPCMMRLLCFTSSKKLVTDLSDACFEHESFTCRRLRESIISVLSFIPPPRAAEAIISALHVLSSRGEHHFVRLEGTAAQEAQAKAKRHHCASDGIALDTYCSNTSYRLGDEPVESVGIDIVHEVHSHVSRLIPEEELSVMVELCHSLVLEVDSMSSIGNQSEDFLMVSIFELLLTRFLDSSATSISGAQFTSVEMMLFAAISSNSDPLQLLSSTRAGIGVLRTLVKLVPSINESFAVDSGSPLSSSRVMLASLVLEMLSTLVVLGPPPPEIADPDTSSSDHRENLLKALVVPLGKLSLTLTSEARVLEKLSDVGETEEEDPDIREDVSMLDLSNKCQELHLQLIRRWSTSSSAGSSDSAPWGLSDNSDKALLSVIQSATTDLMTTCAPLRARAVFDISNGLKQLSAAAERQQPSIFVEEVSDAPESILYDETLGCLLGTLLGMLADSESYVYLGAVHAIRCLTDIPPQAARSRHIKILVSFFAQVPLSSQDDPLRLITTAARLSMEPLMRFHLTQTTDTTQVLSQVLQRLEGENTDGNDNNEAFDGTIVPLSYSQRMMLGEALVLTIRWCGAAVPYHAATLFPALIRGAKPPCLQETSRHQCQEVAAFRSSCFSAIAEVGGFLGWSIQRYAPDLVDLCCSCLRMERDAISLDLDPQLQPEGNTHALAARRGAAFLGRRLIECCGFHMLQSGDSRQLQTLHQLFVDINEGPGVARATRRLRVENAPLEWSLELDPIVRNHVVSALESMDRLLLQGTSGLAAYVLPN